MSAKLLNIDWAEMNNYLSLSFIRFQITGLSLGCTNFDLTAAGPTKKKIKKNKERKYRRRKDISDILCSVGGGSCGASFQHWVFVTTINSNVTPQSEPVPWFLSHGLDAPGRVKNTSRSCPSEWHSWARWLCDCSTLNGTVSPQIDGSAVCVSLLVASAVTASHSLSLWFIKCMTIPRGQLQSGKTLWRVTVCRGNVHKLKWKALHYRWKRRQKQNLRPKLWWFYWTVLFFREKLKCTSFSDINEAQKGLNSKKPYSKCQKNNILEGSNIKSICSRVWYGDTDG